MWDYILAVLRRTYIQIIFVIGTSIFGGIIAYVMQKLPKDTPAWIYVFGVGIFILLITTPIFQREWQRINREKSEHELGEAERKLQRLSALEQRRELTFLQRSLDTIISTLKQTLYEKDRLNTLLEESGIHTGKLQEGAKADLPFLKNGFVNGLCDKRVEVTRNLLREMCENFREDYTYYSSNYKGSPEFKANIFEVKENEDGTVTLYRTRCHSYPEPDEPETSKIDESEYPTATGVICYKTRKFVFVPNVQDEFKKFQQESKDAKWAELRRNQHKEYGSIMSAPIFRGEPFPEKRTAIGVLSITTKVIGYFADEKSDLFRTMVNPYLTLITYLYEVLRTNKIMTDIMKNV